MDFTLEKIRSLLVALKKHASIFQTFEEFILDPSEKVVIMRHDVDLVPQNALRLALIENEYGIKSSYYFRACPGSWNEDIIREIADMGHEVGYHYEDVSLAASGHRAQGSGLRGKGSKKYEVRSMKNLKSI